jgi:ABC transporter substrate binding protein (PQQ-dependent alcohol dehydrogenase system)
MTRLRLLGFALLAGLALVAGPALAQDDGDKPAAPQQNAPVPGPAPSGPVTTAKIGYVDLKNDVRYHPQIAYTRIEISPALHPVEGARLAIGDMKIQTDAANVQLSLDEQQATDANDAVAKLQAMAAAGERFAVVDLPGDMLAQIGPAMANTKITLINATAPQDALREMCLPNVMHAAASDRMLADAYTQFLRHRNWLKVLILQGDQPRDKEMADAFQQSAERLAIQVVARKQFTLSTDPANRENNDSLLITGGLDYDVIYIADSLGEYSRKLPYATQLPRPVIGSTGLTAAEWHWSWDQDSATQVTLRFQRAAEGNRVMSGYDWDAWMAVKAIATAYAKSRSTDPDKIDAYLKGPRLKLDGSKGIIMDFRPWDRQLRMPIVLATSNSTVGAAPFPEFLHENNELDSLGVDQPESKCQLAQQ